MTVGSVILNGSMLYFKPVLLNETVVNFTRDPKSGDFVSSKQRTPNGVISYPQGGADPTLWGRYFLWPAKSVKEMLASGTSYLRSLRRPGPRFNPTKKKAPGCLCLGLGPCDRTECPKTLLGGFGLWRRSTGRLWAEYSYSVNRATVSLRTESSVFLVTFHMARRPWIPLFQPW